MTTLLSTEEEGLHSPQLTKTYDNDEETIIKIIIKGKL